MVSFLQSANMASMVGGPVGFIFIINFEYGPYTISTWRCHRKYQKIYIVIQPQPFFAVCFINTIYNACISISFTFQCCLNCQNVSLNLDPFYLWNSSTHCVAAWLVFNLSSAQIHPPHRLERFDRPSCETLVSPSGKS